MNSQLPATCLLIVDVQHGFLNRHTNRIPSLVQELQHDYAIVFASRFFNPNPSLYRSVLGWHRCGRHSEDFKLAFDPGPNVTIFDKPTYSCVTRGLIASLQKRRIDAVDLCGFDTDACVMQTALNLFDLGILPRVLASFCASSRGKQFHRQALKVLVEKIGKRGVAWAP